MKKRIKLFVSDIDGTLTDGTVYYSKHGEELKQFSHRDGRAFHLLTWKYNIACALITSESGEINRKRFEKFEGLGTVKDFFDGSFTFENGNKPISKKDIIHYLCDKYNVLPDEVAFIGDDTNDLEALEYVGIKACPFDANALVRRVKDIIWLNTSGGKGAVREFVDYLIEKGKV